MATASLARRLGVTAVLVGGLAAVPAAAGFVPLRQAAPPALAAGIAAEVAVPPMHPWGGPPPPPAVFLARALKGYEPDAAGPAEVRADPARYPLRAEVLDTLAVVREAWTPRPAAPPAPKGKKKDRDAPLPLFVVEVRGPITDAYKRKLEEALVGPARGIAKLELQLEALDRLAPKRAAEPKRWQAHYDYAAAVGYSRLAYLHEYDLMVGNLRTERLPELDPAAGHVGWRLVASDKMQSRREGREAALQARERLAKLVEDHPGTPWAVLAARELETPPGLRWEPFAAK